MKGVNTIVEKLGSAPDERSMWVVSVRGDDGELRPCHYIYVYRIESRLIMRVRYDSHIRIQISVKGVNTIVEKLGSAPDYRSSLLGPVVPSFRALSRRLKFTVRRYKFNKDSLLRGVRIWGLNGREHDRREVGVRA